MADQINSSDSYYAPWEKAFGHVVTPIEEFIHREAASGIVLMVCTVTALILANSPLADLYDKILHIHITLGFGKWAIIDHTLHHWINDGLMALFFFVIGLELKREILSGDLANPRAALVPILAAIGGMVVPALIYITLNFGTDGVRGWGIPMATDIAFAIGILALLGKRVPRSLVTFLITLAIFDDLGAVMVIALFYTEQLAIPALIAAAVFLSVLIAFNRLGIRNPWAYFFVAVLLWAAMLESGVHATIAGVLGAMTIPSRPKLDPRTFSERVGQMMQKYEQLASENKSFFQSLEQNAIIQAVERGIHRVESPLQRLEHIWHLPVAFFVMPLFALANAGVPLEPGAVMSTISAPVALGIELGLVVGKLVGIAGVSLLLVKLGFGQLPAGCTTVHIVGVGLLAGIGFTMSIFIAELAFENQLEYLVEAKIGILFASLIAGGTGYYLLRNYGSIED